MLFRSRCSASHCNALQRTATHCNALQRTATHCNALQRSVTHCNTLQRTSTHCNALQCTSALQRTATHFNALQLTNSTWASLQYSVSYPLLACCYPLCCYSSAWSLARTITVRALIYSFHPTNHTRCFTLSCFSLKQYLLHCCNCIPRSHFGVPIPSLHSVVFLDRTLLYSSTMCFCSIVLAQHFNDIHIHTFVYLVTPVKAQDYNPLYTRVCIHT